MPTYQPVATCTSLIAAFAITSLAAHAAAPVTGWVLAQQLGLRGPGEGQFGRALAVSGDWLAIAQTPGNSLTNSGSVSMFHRESGSWSTAGFLDHPDPQAQALFGASVAMSGTHLVVGEPFHAQGALSSVGRVLFYELDSTDGLWNLVTTYSYNQAAAYTGYSVAINGNVAMVGIPGADASSPTRSAAGAVVGWSFAGDHWNSMGALIQAQNALAGDGLGQSVALKVNNGSSRLFVGAPGRTPDPNLDGSGAVWVFDVSVGSATQVDFLTAPNMARLDGFGTSLAFGPGSRVFIGTPGRRYNDQDAAGVAFVYQPAAGGYDLESLVSRGLDAQPGDHFGSSVAFDDTTRTLLVGAPQERAPLDDEGAAHVFHPEAAGGDSLLWMQTQTLAMGIAGNADELGAAVAIDAGHAYLGSPSAPSTSQTGQGRVRVFASDLIFADGLE